MADNRPILRRPWLSVVVLVAAGLVALLTGVVVACGSDDGSSTPPAQAQPTGTGDGRSQQATETVPPLATATPVKSLVSIIPNAARDGFPPTATPTPTPTPSPTPTPVPPTPVPPTPVPTGQGLRFWGGGDSTSAFMNQTLADRYIAAGSPLAYVDYGSHGQSSGLANSGFFNWPAHIEQAMATYAPNIAVFMIGANDAWIGTSDAATQANYAATVGATMDIMDNGERLVVWVGQPNMGRADLVASLPALNAIYRAEADKRANVIFVDTWSITSDANGNYSGTLVNSAGVAVLARADDGVHFTYAGAAILADAVQAAIAAAGR